VSKRQRGTRRPSANLYRPASDDASAQAEPGSPPTSGTGPNAARVTGARTTAGGSTITSRSARRRARTQVAARPKSPLERYRGLLLIGFAVLGVAIIGVVFFSSVSAAPYVCESLLTPGPTDVLPTAGPSIAATPSPSPTTAPSPSGSPVALGSPGASASPSPSVTPVPSPTLRLGFPTNDLGRTHVANGESVTYGFCPPTSGNHYNVAGQAPLPRQFYPPTQSLKPQNWLHNLEHGYVAILYKGTPDQATLDAIRTVMDTAAPPSDGFAQQCGQVNRVIAVRFDDMETPFAVVSWDRALLLPTWDPEQAKTFAEQWQDSPPIPESPSSGGGVC